MLIPRIEASKKDLNELGLFASILGHIGDGNFHESIMYDRKNPEEFAKVEKCVYDMVNLAIDMEGSCTVSSNPVTNSRKESLTPRTGH